VGRWAADGKAVASPTSMKMRAPVLMPVPGMGLSAIWCAGASSGPSAASLSKASAASDEPPPSSRRLPGGDVVDVPSALSARARLLATGGDRRTGPADQRSVSALGAGDTAPGHALGKGR